MELRLLEAGFPLSISALLVSAQLNLLLSRIWLAAGERSHFDGLISFCGLE
jgi:hypothetical protein